MADRTAALPARRVRSVATVTASSAAVLAVVLALVAASCSSGGSVAGPGSPVTSVPAAVAASAHPCTQGATISPVQAVAVPGSATDVDARSFDGTIIRLHWFPAPGAGTAHPDPTVLMGPGWSLAGDTTDNGSVLFGTLSISGLNAAGYNVLTWDPRGFGRSGGVAEIDNPAAEGRDVQMLLDWVAARSEARLDRPGDPRVGMVGFSYGGGIQLTVAAIDCRVDAIVPGLAWHSIQTSLFKADTVKTGWASILTNAAVSGHIDPHISSANASGLATGTISAEDHDWFMARGPGDLVDKVDVPTLFVQGTVDTLFTLDEAVSNYLSLRRRGVPTAMVWFCGGHGMCLTGPGNEGLVTTASFAWLARYLKGDTSVSLGPRLQVPDQDGIVWTGDDYPPQQGTPVMGTGSGTLALTAASVSGPAKPRAGSKDPLAGLVMGVTPARAAVATDVTIDPGNTTGLALGAPKLKFTYRGTTPDGVRPTRVFAQLVDDTTGLVLGNQVTPIDVVLDGSAHTVDTDLEVIAQSLVPGHTVTLQLVATTTAYATPRLGGTIHFDKISVSLPVATGLTERGRE